MTAFSKNESSQIKQRLGFLYYTPSYKGKVAI
jgi:hypothetical protein